MSKCTHSEPCLKFGTVLLKSRLCIQAYKRKLANIEHFGDKTPLRRSAASYLLQG